MKTPSDDLFHLIQSMLKEEKRYYKVYSREYKQSSRFNYMRLFEAIEQQESYDEAALKEKFANELTDNQFAVAKNYLYNSILKMLVSYAGERGGIRKVRQTLRFIEVLYSKELFAQCEKAIRKAEKLARKIDNPFLISEVLDWRFRLWNKRFFQGVSENEFERFNHAIREISGQINQNLEYRLLGNQVNFNLRAKGLLRSSEAIAKALKNLLDHPLFADPSHAHILQSKIVFHNTWGLYNYMSGKFDESFSHFARIIAMIEESPDIVYDYFDLYLSILYNFCSICLHTGKYPEAGEAISKIERLDGVFASQKARIFYYSAVLRIEYSFGTLQFDKVSSLLHKIAGNLDRFDKQLSHIEKLSVYINLSNAFFALDDFRAALRLQMKVLNSERISDFPELQLVAQIVRIIIHFELGNFDLFPELLRSLYRFLTTRKKVFKLEAVVLKFLRKYSAFPPRNEMLQLFRDFRADLQALHHDPEEQRAIQYFDFISWLTAKIENKSFLDILRRKVTASQA